MIANPPIIIADQNAIKDALQQALRDWLNEKFTQFGKWSLTAILAMAFAGLVWSFFTTHGWKMP